MSGTDATPITPSDPSMVDPAASTASVDERELSLASGIFYRRWDVPSPRAVALLVHGMGEHSGRYRHVAKALGSRGIACLAPDHPGHGNSPGHRCHVDAFEEFYPALDALRDEIESDFPGLPCFIIGHSLGGLITGSYLLTRQARFAGAAFSGAAFDVPEPPGAFAIFINKLISALLPKTGVLQLDASEVSRDPVVVQRYREDPLVHSGKITARMVVELFSVIGLLAKDNGKITLPVLVMHGEGDVMTPPSGSERFHATVGSEDKTLRLYPGLFHEIFNEPEQDQVLGELADWLDAHMPAAANAPA